MSQDKPMNIIVVVSDTLRTAYLGCYGNESIQTPNIDRFAASGAIFADAYPESLPTIPVRRALHTGRRAYPFRDYHGIPWDIVSIPGWQPMAYGESTLAEDLAAAGYHTGFVTDTFPYFAPGMNFARGFWQWEYVRGQQQDRWHSVHAANPERVANFWVIGGRPEERYSIGYYHAANTDGLQSPEKTSTARTFKWAMKFLEDNAAVPFYLLVDCFDPHEPWEAPEEYYRLYADGSYPGPIIIHAPYHSNLAGLTEEQLQDAIAHYSGLVTLVDDWFGQLLTKLDALGLTDRTVVIFTSDHGTNFGEGPRRVVGKPSWDLLPGTMHLPLIIRHPSGQGVGQRIPGLYYNLDITATVYDVANAKPSQSIDGVSLLPALSGDQSGAREYVTSRYTHTTWHYDGEWWTFCSIDGTESHIFHKEDLPDCQKDLGDQAGDVFKKAWEHILADAGGELPDYRGMKATDAIGQNQYGDGTIRHVSMIDAR